MGKRIEDLGTTTALIPGNQPTGDQRSEGVAKHTPGPWEVSNYVHVMANGQRLLTVQGPFGHHEKSPNARLIAAAPDMLAALKTTGAILSQLRATTTNDELWAAYSQIISAIVKAEGR